MSPQDSTSPAAQLQAAEALTTQTLRFHPDHQAGFIEFAAPDESGRCWFGGWVRDAAPDEDGALLLDRRKFPGLLRLCRYHRDDLPPGASGFLGLFEGEWQPGPATTEIFLALAGAAPAHLRSLSPLRVVPLRDVALLFEQVEGCRPRGPFAALRDALLAPDSWMAGNAQAAGLPLHCGFDQVLLLPGFGCVVEGWVLSPARPVAGFTLRLDGLSIPAAAEGTRRRARPDLREAFPALAPLAAEAGFVALFRHAGPLPLAGAMLRFVHPDGTASNEELPAARAGWVEAGLGEAELLRAYPALEYEPFAPALAQALAARRLAGRPAPRPALPPAPAPRAVLRAVGGTRSEAFRLFDEAAAHAPLLAARGFGIAFLGLETQRDVLLPLFHGFRRAFAGPASLFLAGGAAPSLAEPAPLLAALGTERFLAMEAFTRLPAPLLEQALDHLAAPRLREAVILGQGLGAAAAEPAGLLGPAAPGRARPPAVLGTVAWTGPRPRPSEMERRLALAAAVAA
ncbi:hypothetical protein ACI6QG_11680 [Roseococcus sp. DSY-14]|uniref:hypothetical protein n=1 Tax=Roseococcus sp. DSY-14 TaxID=3369650 RepID=UPI00387AF917